MRSFLILVLVLFLSACGVDSSSSKAQQSSATDPGTGNDGNGSGSGDGNGSGNGSETIPVIDVSTGAGFSKKDAVKDPNACIANGTFKYIEDSSFDPNSVADHANGLELASQYPYSANVNGTKVVLYYPTLGLKLLGKSVNVYEANYRLTFDKAWSSSKNSSVYIRTPKDSKGIHSCYRYELSSLSGAGITRTKVYR